MIENKKYKILIWCSDILVILFGVFGILKLFLYDGLPSLYGLNHAYYLARFFLILMSLAAMIIFPIYLMTSIKRNRLTKNILTSSYWVFLVPYFFVMFLWDYLLNGNINYYFYRYFSVYSVTLIMEISFIIVGFICSLINYKKHLKTKRILYYFSAGLSLGISATFLVSVVKTAIRYNGFKGTTFFYFIMYTILLAVAVSSILVIRGIDNIGEQRLNTSTPKTGASINPDEELRRLVKLHEDGIITDSEFEEKRSKYINLL